MDEPSKTCRYCHWWFRVHTPTKHTRVLASCPIDYVHGDGGSCRRYAPSGTERWPITMPDESCGEWREQQGEVWTYDERIGGWFITAAGKGSEGA